jgi:hypothetical protein
VRLACLAVTPEANGDAVVWLRQQLPRRSRVNLRPVGSEDGILVARVNRLEGGANGPAGPPNARDNRPGPDLAQGLVDAGLASWLPNCNS